MVFIMQLVSIVFTVNHLFVRSMYRPTADERGQTLMLHSHPLLNRVSIKFKFVFIALTYVGNNCDTLTIGLGLNLFQ